MSQRLCEGFAKTRLSVTTLNKHVVTALISQGLPAVAISPCPFVGTVKKKLPDSQLSSSATFGIVGLLKRGLVPVVHGDAVLDMAQGAAILSGDVWMVEFCKELVAKSAVFVTDVDGVFTRPPSEPGAELVREILVDMKTGELELTGVSMNTASHDVTGGLKAKLESAAEVLVRAPSVQAVYIVRAGSEAAAQALRGVTPMGGTTLRRKPAAGR
uniref:Aspartate/glutamate/uridylate kinase domain-containing protein n=1 Tax=Alexandrium monilatum TaxID=311494 RepID=A0A7S4UZI1_9DINO